ncbi:TonB-dependent siderophore receptor [Aquabacterium soli]|uniref:TonB-dependent siderophore receptor n=1 Tax=Aquabacterium soli TaxID=2493092 RepID=UPI001F29DC39|nr:TonB-dependent receptor [Aquabacterium soli]
MFLYGAVGGGKETMDTMDARLSGQFSLGGRKHDVFVGFSSLRTDTRTDGYTDLAVDPTRYVYSIPNVNTWDGTAPVPNYRRTGAYTVQQTSQDAVYASARWRLAEPLSLLTGARVTNWRRHTDNYGTTGAYVRTTARQSVGQEVSPFLGVVYDLNEYVSAYASHTGIFNPQNYKDRFADPLSPVKGKSNELGLKGEWPEHGISGSFAFFEVKQDNYGVKDGNFKVPGETADAYVAVNGTKSFGWEADIAARLNSNWQATAGVTRVKTTRNAFDLTYANLPEWLVKLGTQYRFSGVLQPVELGAQLLWQGQMDAVNVPSPSGRTKVKQSPFGLLNLNASWRFTEATSVNLAVTNALDKHYLATLDYANYGEPRFISLTLRTRF